MDRGKQLEELVAFVESRLLPTGFDIKSNDRVFNEDGEQLAEFDIDIRGRLGSTEIAWLIECRDRPSQGPAPGSWIEQLAGRKSRFGFHKVTAVSTTGFASGAAEFARSQGIELREVRTLSADAFQDWFETFDFIVRTRHADLASALLEVDPSESDERKLALREMLKGVDREPTILRVLQTGEKIAPWTAFSRAVDFVGTLYNDMVPGGAPKDLSLHARYPDEAAHFVVDTPAGSVRIWSIKFEGSIRIAETALPLSLAAEYRQCASGEVISQVVGFAPMTIHGVQRSFQIHRLPSREGLQIVLRNAPNRGA